MKLPRTLAQRPTPQMPVITGFEPRFDPIPGLHTKQPDRAVRPLYWWAQNLRQRGDVLVGIQFDPAQLAASVTVRLASYRVVEVKRHRDDKPQLPHDLPTVLSEAVWRLGVLGWTDELDQLRRLLRTAGLLGAPVPVHKRTTPIPGCSRQPDRGARAGYWWALALVRHGWQLHAYGQDIAAHGFIAEIPGADGESTLVLYPGNMADDGTEAAALANHLARLAKCQRRAVQRVIADAAAGNGRGI